MNPELSPSPRDTPSFPSPGPSSPHSHGLEGTLPPLPVEAPIPLSCFEKAWDLLHYPTLANTMLERQQILKNELGESAGMDRNIEEAKACIQNLEPLTCRERIFQFFRWQATATPEVPLHLASRIIDDRALENEAPLSRINAIAESLVTSGFVQEHMAREVLVHLHEDILAKNPLSKGPAMLSMALTAAAYTFLPPPVVFASILASAFFMRAYQRASWARHEYTIGYLQEVFDTHTALSRGESPTIIRGLQTHYNWDRNERFRADGYMIARTLRILEVPSAVIHTAYATTASVELQDQPLVNLLEEKLNSIHLKVSGCLAAEYVDSHKSGGELAKTLDALNECYFAWGKRSGRIYQNKMIELLQGNAPLFSRNLSSSV